MTSSLDAPVRPRSLGTVVRAYVALTKPRVIELLLVTTIPVMVLAERGIPSLWLVVATVVGGALSAGSANAYNMFIDRDIDVHMGRTSARPLVTGDISGRSALVICQCPGSPICRVALGFHHPSCRCALAGRNSVLRLRLHAMAQEAQ
jgi:heme O synthase-like polyprenyltransferase